MSDFSKDFHLEPLIHASAIIVDENDVGVYLDKVANLKAVITNDVVLINRKFKMPVSYQFFGFMVQCLNEYPRIGIRLRASIAGNCLSHSINALPVRPGST